MLSQLQSDDRTDETSRLLISSRTMDPDPIGMIENGDGTPEKRNIKNDGDSNGNAASNGDEDRAPTNEKQSHGSFLLPFFVNIFLACASFSIAMPSLSPYILEMGVPLAFLPWVVSIYSLGEMLGSVAIGYLYEYATSSGYKAGRGPRFTLMLCMILGIIGSFLYVVAGWVENKNVAKSCLGAARLLQGIWTGGQQTVEQAYLSAAVNPSKRTEYTATLSTCAMLGFVIGPAIGAFLSQIDMTIAGLPVNANNSSGAFMLVATSVMFFQTALFFDGTDEMTGNPTDDKEPPNPSSSATTPTSEMATESTQESTEIALFNHIGVSLCMMIFYIHYYSFAVQETITTPMVAIIFEWGPLETNLLFVCSGGMSLIACVSQHYLARNVDDRSVLLFSILVGFGGSLLSVDLPFSQTLPVWRFILGFGLLTIAFPLGRTAVLGIFSNVLGETNQGQWMGIMFAISAFPRVIGPFASLQLLISVDWQTWLEYGICAGLFAMTLLATWRHRDILVPYPEFQSMEEKRMQRIEKKRMRDHVIATGRAEPIGWQASTYSYSRG